MNPKLYNKEDIQSREMYTYLYRLINRWDAYPVAPFKRFLKTYLS